MYKSAVFSTESIFKGIEIALLISTPYKLRAAFRAMVVFTILKNRAIPLGKFLYEILVIICF